MKKFLNIELNDLRDEFETYIRDGGFPDALKYPDEKDRLEYTKNVISDIFEKDIKPNEKIQNVEMFDSIEKYVINNFGSILSIDNIVKYYQGLNINIDYRTVERYIKILENAKIIYPCDEFDVKSKRSLGGNKKYYLSDLSIYYSLNTDNRISYGPVLENIIRNYLISKGYSLSVGKIGELEIDFIARKDRDDYFYIQISKNIEEDKTKNREYRPFYEIKDMYPRYLFTLDLIIKDNVDGIRNKNIIKFISNNEDLK